MHQNWAYQFKNLTLGPAYFIHNFFLEQPIGPKLFVDRLHANVLLLRVKLSSLKTCNNYHGQPKKGIKFNNRKKKIVKFFEIFLEIFYRFCIQIFSSLIYGVPSYQNRVHFCSNIYPRFWNFHDFCEVPLRKRRVKFWNGWCLLTLNLFGFSKPFWVR